MYKVYRDPAGKRFLEPSHHTSPIHKSSLIDKTEEGYKKRIESLNEEIKVLNDEVERVYIPY